MTAATVYGSYKREHYASYIGAAAAKRPPLLDQFLDCKANHASKLHVAILVNRGRILATATNKVASRSSGASARGCQNYIHAERNLLKAVDLNLLRGSVIYVMRIAAAGFMYSQPCEECTVLLNKCIKAYGLKKVYFTTTPASLPTRFPVLHAVKKCI